MEEVGLAALFPATLALWLHDESPNQARTRAALRGQLGDADRLVAGVWGKAPPPGA